MYWTSTTYEATTRPRRRTHSPPSPHLVERRHRRVVVLYGVLHVVRRVLPVVQAPRRPQGRRVRRARRRRPVLLPRLRVRDRRGRGRGRVVTVASGTWVTEDELKFLSHSAKCYNRHKFLGTVLFKFKCDTTRDSRNFLNEIKVLTCLRSYTSLGKFAFKADF